MRRLFLLVTLAVLLATMLVVSAGPAHALRLVGRVPFGPSGGFSTSHTVCTTAVGSNANALHMFEWRAGGEVCWINAPAQEAHDLVE
jgi:hypothetical protein